ncbi:hypothetical protein ACFYU9_21090 [Streptomyces sp. NPDC004327]|uniref:hypothetical protein n=1 Tax=unclassified Streptomyces TaxID=2593676 RepID=UPI00367A9B6B
MTPDSEADVDDALRAVFARAVGDITPGPVPLAAVRRRGRAIRRRRTATVAALAALAVSGVVTVTAVSLTGSGRPATAAPPAPVTAAATSPVAPPATSPVTPVRVVRAGERVTVRGWTVWLTSDGKHWKDPDGVENFRSVSDGNLDTAQPGISHQSEGNAAGAFHSGLYYGTRDAGRVELRGADGRTAVATLLELPGRPGWGVWYVYTALTDPGVDLYDARGARLAGYPGTPTGR